MLQNFPLGPLGEVSHCWSMLSNEGEKKLGEIALWRVMG